MSNTPQNQNQNQNMREVIKSIDRKKFPEHNQASLVGTPKTSNDKEKKKRKEVRSSSSSSILLSFCLHHGLGLRELKSKTKIKAISSPIKIVTVSRILKQNIEHLHLVKSP